MTWNPLTTIAATQDWQYTPVIAPDLGYVRLKFAVSGVPVWIAQADITDPNDILLWDERRFVVTPYSKILEFETPSFFVERVLAIRLPIFTTPFNVQVEVSDQPFAQPLAQNLQLVIDQQLQTLQWCISLYQGQQIQNALLQEIKAGQPTQPTQHVSTYYGVLSALNPWELLKLNDSFGDVHNDSGAIVGTYVGNCYLEYDSLLPSVTDRGVKFNSGAIVLNQGITAPPSYTLAVRFLADSNASGGFFGFSNMQAATSGGSYDRNLYLDAQGKINFYNHNGSAYYLTTANSYRDGQPHTLVARMGAGQTTAIFIDGVKVAETSTTGAANYSGWWKIGWSSEAGLASGIISQGAAIFHTALTDSQITSIHAAV